MVPGDLGSYQAKENHSKHMMANSEHENEDGSNDKITDSVTNVCGPALCYIVLHTLTPLYLSLSVGAQHLGAVGRRHEMGAEGWSARAYTDTLFPLSILAVLS